MYAWTSWVSYIITEVKREIGLSLICLFSQWFEQVLTEKSVCYTFNHPKRQEWLSTQTSTPIKQWNGGSSSGLQLMLDARTVKCLCMTISTKPNLFMVGDILKTCYGRNLVMTH